MTTDVTTKSDRTRNAELHCRAALMIADSCRVHGEDGLLMAAWDQAVYHRHEYEASKAIDAMWPLEPVPEVLRGDCKHCGMAERLHRVVNDEDGGVWVQCPDPTCCRCCGRPWHLHDWDENDVYCPTCTHAEQDALELGHSLPPNAVHTNGLAEGALCDHCGALHIKVNDPGLDGHYCPACTEVIYDELNSENGC